MSAQTRAAPAPANAPTPAWPTSVRQGTIQRKSGCT
jgi:hypothetical protein